MKNKPVVILFGATAVGKTSFLEHIAHSTKTPKVEVISADSRQIYKNCSISTAHPPSELTKKIKHHLVATRDFTQDYCVATFVHQAHQKIKSIHERGSLPIVSGGTAYYMYHLWYGLPNTPPRDESIRLELSQQLEQCGSAYLHKELSVVDPDYALSISVNDSQRIVRALEIYRSTGKTVSEHDCTTPDTSYNYLVIGLTRDKKELHTRIALRVEQMFEQGIVDEVFLLYKAGLTIKHNAARTIGIQEFLSEPAVLQAWNAHTQPDESIVMKVKEQIIIHTRQYAKRQMTFFKRFKEVQWYNVNDSKDSHFISKEKLAEMLTQFLIDTN